MSPTRQYVWAGFTLANFKQAMTPPGDPATGVLTALVTIVTAFFNVHVIWLFILVVVGGLLDLWTGARRARIRTRLGQKGGFDREILDEGMSGKGAILIAILFLGVASDSLAVMASGAADLGAVDFFRSSTPVTAGLLAWRLWREAASIRQNIEETPGGKDAVWPGGVKVLDALFYRILNPGGGALPQKRWGDHIPPEERAWIDEHLADWRAKRPVSETPEES